MLIAGIDEAGRGPVLGPLVLAVACIEKKDEEKLVELGVKDSKLLNVETRESQYLEIKKIVCEYGCAHIEAEEIDTLRDRKSLNEIEAMRAGFLLNNLKKKPELVYVDAPDTIAENFAKRIEKYISFPTIIKSEHKADENYPIVSAASILAKVDRDEAIKKLRAEFGEIGSGYPHDAVTINFLNDWMQKNKSMPYFARKSWDTARKIIEKKFQKKLGEW